MTLRRCSSCRLEKTIEAFQGKRDPTTTVKTCAYCRRPSRQAQRAEAVKRQRAREKETRPPKKTDEEKKEHRRQYMRNYYTKRQQKSTDLKESVSVSNIEPVLT